MGRLRSLDRTAVFAWSNGAGSPLIVTGTRTGALDDSFSSETKLELWNLKLDSLGEDEDWKPLGSITTDAGFNDLAWSEPSADYPLGVIAGALDNGSVDIWDARKLKDGGVDAFISRTTKHSGPAKALQWNPFRHGLLASVGAKGEIFIYDLKNMANPFRLGATTARADDIECLDWNKSEKTAHIVATGSSGGSVTVWDVKLKKEVLQLHSPGRKAFSAVAWDPEESTRLATATSNDQDPVVMLWSLRNAQTPERTLQGHELGVLGLSWCLQDPELLLSCGKDNRTVCWNPRTGEKYGDFAAGSNWAFETRWNPHNPSLIASASFDGKVLITSIQNTNSSKDEQVQANQTLDSEDFFAKAQVQPQGITFSIPKTPKWNSRPSSVSFGFGGKLVHVARDAKQKKSRVSVEAFSVDDSVGEAATKFEQRLDSGDMASICATKIDEASTEEEKADWKILQTLSDGNSRKKLVEYLGLEPPESSRECKAIETNGEKAETNGEANDDFFGSVANDDTFLADLASTKGARTNQAFSLYTGAESAADKAITQNLMFGKFEAALDVCLGEEGRMSDAFMIAICGGQKCMDKAQNAYLKKMSKEAQGRSYLRLLASVVGKNLVDLVHNASLNDWREIMATLCTYADETEFASLCEVLGDRLNEESLADDSKKDSRRNATFCYLVGSKLDRVVANWVQESSEQEQSALKDGDAASGQNDFSVHAKFLQDFIEKVSVFRSVTGFKDTYAQQNGEHFKLAPLYASYVEYADILAANGLLTSAEKYLDLLPPKFGNAESAQQRIRLATKKRQSAVAGQRMTAVRTLAPQPTALTSASQPLIKQARNATSSPGGQYAPIPAPQSQFVPQATAYTPPGYQPPAANTPYAPYGGYQPTQPTTAPSIPPPPRPGPISSPSSGPPPGPAAATKNAGNWNDMPDNFLKERQGNSRRGTPGPQPVSSPFPNAAPQQSVGSPPPPPLSGYGQRIASPLAPPPKAGEAPPKITSPPSGPPQSVVRPTSAAGSRYAPTQPASQPPVAPLGSTLPTPSAPPLPRGASPYQPPPSTSSAAPTSRYAPTAGSQASPAPGSPYGQQGQRQVAPNPYMQQQQPTSTPYAPQQGPYGQPVAPPPQAQAPPPRAAPPKASGPPPSGPPRNTPQPRSVAPQQPLPQTAADANTAAAEAPAAPPVPLKPKYPRGDRSHISSAAQPIVNIMQPEVDRIKVAAPQQFKAHVDDMEKRIGILFDALNNDELGDDLVAQLVELSGFVQGRDWDAATRAITEMQKRDTGGDWRDWMVGVKRLINIGKATKS